MKKRVVSILSGLVLVGLMVSIVGAQATIQTLPGGGWVTGTQVQNVGDGPATIQMTVYDQSSQQWSKDYPSVPVGGSVNIGAADFAWPSGTIGSAIVSSDKAIVAQTTETNGTAAGQYQGVALADTTVNFPLVKNNYLGSNKYTTFFVQNAGGQSAVIYAVYTDANGTVYRWNSGAPVAPGRMVVLNPTDVSFPTTLLGSLVVTSTVPLAGVVNEHQITAYDVLQATRGFTPGDAGTTLLIPTIKQNFGNRSTGPIIQNASMEPVTITIKYSGSTFEQYARNVAPGASVTFFNNAEVCPAGATCGRNGTPLANGTLTAAVVTGSGNIVGLVNETFVTIPSGQRQRQTVTSAFNQAHATTSVGVPLYKVHHDYKFSGLQIQNTNLSVTAHYTATFSLGTGATAAQYVLAGTIPPGSAVTLFKLFASIPAGSSWVGASMPSAWSVSSTSTERFGSVVVEADQPIVAVVTEADDDPVVGARQDIKSYEAFNLP